MRVNGSWPGCAGLSTRLQAVGSGTPYASISDEPGHFLPTMHGRNTRAQGKCASSWKALRASSLLASIGRSKSHDLDRKNGAGSRKVLHPKERERSHLSEEVVTPQTLILSVPRGCAAGRCGFGHSLSGPPYPQHRMPSRSSASHREKACRAPAVCV